jgi:DNA-binding transcriptional ArsR family regulator
MGLTKFDLHSDNINLLSTLIKALSQPARLRIVEYIKIKGICNNRDLVTDLRLSQSTVSEHIGALRSINIIQATPVGNSVMYSLHTELLQEFVVALEMFFR